MVGVRFYPTQLFSMRIFCCFVTLILLSGCTGSLIRLKLEDPQANDYPSALAAEYLAYAQSEAELGHFVTADYFADKGMKAASGEAVEPETPAITSAKPLQEELMKARGELVALQTDDIKRVAPQKVARAQLLYDCWSHQKSLAAAELAPCQDEFRSTLTEIQMIGDSFIYGQETSHLFNFAMNKSTLNEKSRALIKEISDRALCVANYALEIEPHGDRKTLALSQKRANAIRAGFIAKGIPPAKIKIKSQNDGKVVHLSNDEDVTGVNEIKVMMRTFGMVGI